MPLPCFSVVLPTHNRAWSLERAIDSVLAQTCRDFELVVVDDGSTDRTPDILERYAGRIVSIRQANSGVSAARNRGIRESKGTVIAFLDSDDEWMPTKLDAQKSFFESHPTRTICQTTERWIRNGRFVNIPNIHKKLHGEIFGPSLKKCMITCSSVAIRRELLDEVGFFNESLPACEDYDLWLRITCQYPVDLIPCDHLTRYGGHPDQLSTRFFGNDRYRIRSILHLLENVPLAQRQRELAIEELRFKCSVYGQGCLKRGRDEEGQRFLMIPKSYC